MKKFVWILLALCLVLGCGVGYAASQNAPKGSGEPAALYDPENSAAPELPEEPIETPAAAEEPEEPAEAEEPEQTETAPLRVLDYAALWALHEPDEIVGSVDGRDVSWDEYFYWLHNWGTEAESYIRTMAMYGQSLDWGDKLSAESDETLAEYVLTLANDYTRQFSTIEALAEDNGAGVTPAQAEELAAALQETIVSACGEGASEEEFNALLAESYISRGMYDRVGKAEYLVNNIRSALYGENSAAISEEEARAYLEEKGYLCATHILFMTIDPETYETLDEETIAQKAAQAKAVYDELAAIGESGARLKRFAELKEQYCEDSGKARFPDGYLFTPGTMVTEFEDAVNALAEYEVSEPVQSFYGYHVIMRLPLDVEMAMSYSDDGAPKTARDVYADEQFNAMMSAKVEASVLTLNDDVAALDLTNYLVEAE